MDSYVVKTRTGLGTNAKNSIVGVFVGFLLFLGSFVLLWINEGRLDMSKVAKRSVVLTPGVVDPAMNNKWASLTAPVTLTGNLADPLYINPGPYLQLKREVEVYAWVERTTSKEEKQLGGSTETTTQYDYFQEWTRAESVKSGSDFKFPDGHRNPTPSVKSERFSAALAMIGGYSFIPRDAELPEGVALSLTPEVVRPGFLVREGRIYLSAFNPMLAPGAAPGAAPAVMQASLGDARISFEALQAPSSATLFGLTSSGAIVPYVAEDESSFLRLFTVDRESAIKQLSSEFTTLTWVLRVVGFLLMWIGLQMFFGPINTLLDIVPFLGSAGRFLVGAASFPVALALTIATILISVVFHNIYLLIAVLVILVGLVVWRARSRKSATS